MMDFYEGGIAAAVASVITAIITWLTTRKRQRNDFVKHLQDSIDLLAEKNKELMQEVVAVRLQNASLIEQVGNLKASMGDLKRENKHLSEQLKSIQEKQSKQ